MRRPLSSLLSETSGRSLTPLEAERLQALSLESEMRIKTAMALLAHEARIVAAATDQYCDLLPQFQAPPGSERRMKGYRDGRLLLGYVAQSIREGSSEPLIDRVLSWFIARTEEGAITALDIEIYLHYMIQACRRELPASVHPFIEEVLEEGIFCCQQGSAGAWLNKKRGRLSEAAIERLMQVQPAIERKFGVATQSKGKRDFEYLIKELANSLMTPNFPAAREKMLGWLVEQLVGFVDYPSDVWNWSFLSIQEAINKICGADVAMRTAPLLEAMASSAPRLPIAAAIAKGAGGFAQRAATELARGSKSLGLYSQDEFLKLLTGASQLLLVKMAVAYAQTPWDQAGVTLSELWTDHIVPRLPFQEPAFATAVLRVQAEIIKRDYAMPGIDEFLQGFVMLEQTLARCQAAERLAAIAGDVADRAAGWCLQNLNTFRAAEGHGHRATFRDLRLLLSRVILAVPSAAAPETVSAWVVDMLLPNLQAFPVNEVQDAYRSMEQVLKSQAQPADAALIAPYFQAVIDAAGRHARVLAARSQFEAVAEDAVRRGYSVIPNHPTLQNQGAQRGKRDAILLLEQAVKAASIGGAVGAHRLQHYFQEKIARMSGLPGACLQAYLGAMVDHLGAYPDLCQLLRDLQKVVPAAGAGLKIFKHSDKIADQATRQVMDRLPAYRDRVGPSGLIAAIRDNSITLRGLGHALMTEPAHPEHFKTWWRGRIEKLIATRPDGLFRNNKDAILSALNQTLDPEETRIAAGFLETAYEGLN